MKERERNESREKLESISGVLSGTDTTRYQVVSGEGIRKELVGTRDLMLGLGGHTDSYNDSAGITILFHDGPGSVKSEEAKRKTVEDIIALEHVDSAKPIAQKGLLILAGNGFDEEDAKDISEKLDRKVLFAKGAMSITSDKYGNVSLASDEGLQVVSNKVLEQLEGALIISKAKKRHINKAQKRVRAALKEEIMRLTLENKCAEIIRQKEKILEKIDAEAKKISDQYDEASKEVELTKDKITEVIENVCSLLDEIQTQLDSAEVDLIYAQRRKELNPSPENKALLAKAQEAKKVAENSLANVRENLYKEFNKKLAGAQLKYKTKKDEKSKIDVSKKEQVDQYMLSFFEDQLKKVTGEYDILLRNETKFLRGIENNRRVPGIKIELRNVSEMVEAFQREVEERSKENPKDQSEELLWAKTAQEMTDGALSFYRHNPPGFRSKLTNLILLQQYSASMLKLADLHLKGLRLKEFRPYVAHAYDKAEEVLRSEGIPEKKQQPSRSKILEHLKADLATKKIDQSISAEEYRKSPSAANHGKLMHDKEMAAKTASLLEIVSQTPNKKMAVDFKIYVLAINHKRAEEKLASLKEKMKEEHPEKTRNVLNKLLSEAEKDLREAALQLDNPEGVSLWQSDHDREQQWQTQEKKIRVNERVDQKVEESKQREASSPEKTERGNTQDLGALSISPKSPSGASSGQGRPESPTAAAPRYQSKQRKR